MRREIGWSDGGVTALELVGGFADQLFNGEFSTFNDDAPFADVARCESFRGADDRVVR